MIPVSSVFLILLLFGLVLYLRQVLAGIDRAWKLIEDKTLWKIRGYRRWYMRRHGVRRIHECPPTRLSEEDLQRLRQSIREIGKWCEHCGTRGTCSVCGQTHGGSAA